VFLPVFERSCIAAIATQNDIASRSAFSAIAELLIKSTNRDKKSRQSQQLRQLANNFQQI